MAIISDEATIGHQQQRSTVQQQQRQRRSLFLRQKPFKVCIILTLSIATIVTMLQSMGQLNGNYNLLLTSTAEQRMTLTDRAWEREKTRRRIIHNRLQQRQVIESTTNATDAAQHPLAPAGSLPSIPSSGKFDWHLPPVRSEYTLSEPQLFANDTMIVIVLSARGNFERRAVVRETWARRHAVYFVVGAPVLPEDVHIQKQLRKEQEQYNDIIDSLQPDMYSSLPYKLRFAYQWVITRLPNAEWIVKVDDDTVVRVDTLQNAFLRSFNPHIPVVVGRIIERSPVARTGKWRELNYPETHYPFWPQGSCGHVVSRVVAAYIASMTPKSFTYYQGEDVSLGIWLDQAPPDKLEPVSWIHSRYFSNDGACFKHAWLIMGHGISAERMRACYSAKDEWPVEEVTNKLWNYWTVDTLKWKKEQQTW